MTPPIGSALGQPRTLVLGINYLTSIRATICGRVLMAPSLSASVIAIPAVAHWKLGMGSVFAFWFAYTVTRPLGASLADWLGIQHRFGGLDWGRGTVAILLTVPILIAVAYMAITHVDMARPAAGGSAAPLPPVRARHRAV